MKNDIDSILNSLFSGGRLHVGENTQSRAAREAEEFLKSIEQKDRSIGNSLNRQLGDLEKINSEAQKSMEEMRRLLENDDAPAAAPPEKAAEEKPTAKGAEEPPRDVAQSFSAAREAAGGTVIGQDAFLDSLFTAFKRPAVTGTAEGKPAAVIVISGREGTGRHSALSVTASSLTEAGMLKNGRVARVDLALYPNAEDGRLLTQDLFSALQSESDVVLFEHFEQCHKSLLPMLASLAETGVLKLTTRYAMQKGMLIDVGTALVPNAVSEIRISGQYLVFLTDRKDSELADAFGAPFLAAVTDFCRTEAFTQESLLKIGGAAAQALAKRCKERLQFTVAFEEDAVKHLTAQFSPKDGVESINRAADRCFRLLSEEKLRRNAGGLTGTACMRDGALAFVFPDFTVTAGGEKQTVNQAAVEAVKAEMDRIVGLQSVKDYVLSLEQNYVIQRLRESRGMKADVPAMHMIFTGNPGTGKTTIARLVSRYLKAMGVLTGGQLIEVTRADLVGKYVGHTAPLTQQVIRSAIGGVLFIDEAYALYRGADDSFGLEAIDTIVKGMEDNRENLIVILAGYSREMEEFLTANSGLKSRFPNIIEFPDYTAEELLKITRITVENKGYALSPDCAAPLTAYFDRRQKADARTAGNGRMARNLVEDAILNQSRRLTVGDVSALTKETLETLLPEDFELE
ncbi:MAG: AAA family ATPase [Hominenteromicrobium sp.]